jgi:hypothetical protein
MVAIPGCDHHQAVGKLMAAAVCPITFHGRPTSRAVKKTQKISPFFAKTEVWLILFA